MYSVGTEFPSQQRRGSRARKARARQAKLSESNFEAPHSSMIGKAPRNKHYKKDQKYSRKIQEMITNGEIPLGELEKKYFDWRKLSELAANEHLRFVLKVLIEKYPIKIFFILKMKFNFNELPVDRNIWNRIIKWFLETRLPFIQEWILQDLCEADVFNTLNIQNEHDRHFLMNLLENLVDEDVALFVLIYTLRSLLEIDSQKVGKFTQDFEDFIPAILRCLKKHPSLADKKIKKESAKDLFATPESILREIFGDKKFIKSQILAASEPKRITNRERQKLLASKENIENLKTFQENDHVNES